MKIKIRKTDKRHTGHDKFQYYVDIKSTDWNENSQLMFYKFRMWCWETWGPSRELNDWNVGNKSDQLDQDPGDRNAHWAWINDQYRFRLYLGSKDEAAHFTLKWGI